MPGGQAAADQAAPRPGALHWIREAGRTLVLRRPHWDRLDASPVRLLLIVFGGVLLTIGIERAFIAGPATFNWRASMLGAAMAGLYAYACYLLRPRPTLHAASRTLAPSAAHLFSLVYAQALCMNCVLALITYPLMRLHVYEAAPVWGQWALWLAPQAWAALAVTVLMLRSGDRKWLPRIAMIGLVTLIFALGVHFERGSAYWYETPAASAEPQEEALHFTQSLVEDQAPLLDEQLQALKPQRPGTADMYTITFAPYEGEEVFRRESRMVSQVMASRFDAGGRGLQLLNHREHLEDMVWATPVNLQRAIEGIAETMDRDEDVLFIHLTSHGARDGELAANFWPLDPEAVTPPDLRKWLDDAGIRHRVISISACFSGSWIDPLFNEDTLVMTASDADHTSYGCGKKSPLTFFGRAMYDEQLRSKTLSFEEAHAASRTVIQQREIEGGKDDGYSNPQIRVGSRIRPYLEKMRARLSAPAPK